MANIDGITVIGVRHLSPAAATAVIQTLNAKQPDLVLIEGPSDATHLIDKILHPEIKLPVSLLAYTRNTDRTLAYPLVEYSPEYQAMLWTKKNNSKVEFIDLPAKTFLALNEEKYTPSKKQTVNRIDIYQELADRAGESSYDAYWERNFEHLICGNSFREMTFELGATLRKLEETSNEFFHLENLTREAYMRRCISDAVGKGTPAEKIAVVLGAYHAPVMNSSEHIMTDKEFKALPTIPCAITLMPYSYFRLSRQSGYGAGNSAPLYFASLFEEKVSEDRDLDLADYPNRYLAELVDYLRLKGQKISSAQLIDAVQLCLSLSMLKSGPPVLEDLRSAAETCFAAAIPDSLKISAFNFLEIGSRVGDIPEGLVMTSIQDDFNEQIKKLYLEKYKNDHLSELSLDLRENRQVKSKEAAFRDLARSNFFNQLNFLKIPFAKLRQDQNNSPTWKEKWFVRWQPESEIALVDSVLWGETIKSAVHARFNYEIQQCNKLVDLTRLLRKSLNLGYEKLTQQGALQLGNMSVTGTDFIDLSHACKDISYLIKFGSIRRIKVKNLEPLLEQLFLEASLLLYESADCDDQRKNDLAQAVLRVHRDVQNHPISSSGTWIKALEKLAYSTERNPYLSGLVFSLLLEWSKIDDSDINQEISKRLSPGMASDLALGWFEGFLSHNPVSMIHKEVLWRVISDYVLNLDNDEFKKSLVLLRRTLSAFSDDQKKQIARTLIKLWGLNKEVAADLMEIELTDEECSLLDDLDDLDF